MKTVEIRLDKAIEWPDCCAYCMAGTHQYVASKYSVISGVNPFFYTRKFVTIEHPVCRKHRFLGRFYGFLSHQSFVDLFVGLLFIPFLFFLPIMLMSLVPSAYESLVWAIFCLAYVAVIMVFRAKAPVKLVTPKDNAAKIRFSNDAYARAFQKLNG